MKIVVLDDEQNALEFLVDTIRNAVPQSEIHPYSSARMFEHDMPALDADVYFLDIRLAGSNGLEISERIKSRNPRSNIIFVTAYDDYKANAMDLHASDYLLKPVTESRIREAFSYLRYQTSSGHNSLYAKTFGSFTFFVNKRPVFFHRRKSKELLAYLVGRRGEVVSRQTLSYVLFGDEAHSRQSQKKLYMAARALIDDLGEVGVEDLVLSHSEGLALDAAKITSDLYDYLDGNQNLYHGYYMEDYEWGEDFKGEQTGYFYD